MKPQFEWKQDPSDPPMGTIPPGVFVVYCIIEILIHLNSHESRTVILKITHCYFLKFKLPVITKASQTQTQYWAPVTVLLHKQYTSFVQTVHCPLGL